MVSRYAVLFVLFTMPIDATMNVKLPPGCAVFFVSNSGSNSNATDARLNPTQRSMAPFQFEEPSGYLHYLWYALGAYAAAVLMVEYYIYSVEYGIIAQHISSKEKAELRAAIIYQAYLQNHPGTDALFQVHQICAHEYYCVQQLARIVSLPPARLLCNYARAQGIVRRYKKAIDTLYRQFIVTDLVQTTSEVTK